jgi:hypothetical protein
VMQSTSSEAVLVAMLAAKGKALRNQPPEATLKLVAYASDQVSATDCYILKTRDYWPLGAGVVVRPCQTNMSLDLSRSSCRIKVDWWIGSRFLC